MRAPRAHTSIVALVVATVTVLGTAGPVSAARPTGPPVSPGATEPVCRLTRFAQNVPLSLDGTTVPYSFGTITYSTARAAANLYASRRGMPKLVRIAGPTVAFVNDPALAVADPRLANLDDDVWSAIQGK